MSWTNLTFVIEHAARVAGNASMTPAAASGFPAYYLRDGGADHLAKFGSSVADARIDIDRDSGTLSTLDRLVIPSGHNLGAQTVDVYGSATGAFAGEETTLRSFTSAAGLINQTLSTPSSHRYLRVVFRGTGQWELGELVLGRTVTPTRGPAAAWSDPYAPNLLTYVFDSGAVCVLELGPALKTFNVSWDQVPTADAVLFESVLLDMGYGLHSVWMQLPDTAEPLRLMRLLEPATRAQTGRNPQGAAGPRYAYGMRLIEDIS